MALAGAVMCAPTAAASPETDAYDAITATWEAAGGATSPLGSPHGDVYPVGGGFAQNFAGGKMFFTPETGARAMYGAILDKYESLGGPANSDLGFPNTDEVPGLVSPDSRVTMLSGSSDTDHPVIFFTPQHGAHVVRGPINAGWDKLGSSTGALGVPVDDETYGSDQGAVITQKFSAGQLSWNSKTRTFTTVPPELAAQLADLQIPVDPTAAINEAWRATGGATGPLGARQGGQYQVGNDGVGQDFTGGKVYFSPATGAGAVEGDILAKYESLGGPVGSDLGFPVANEADGGIPGSRISRFSGDGEPVIFFTSDNGAFVVRSAMQVAWDKLGDAAGKLGAPVGDQTVEGDVVSQKFTGGKISWNSKTNTFSTEPADLATSLSGLQIPGVPHASSSATSTGAGHGLAWHWWWLAAAVAVLAALAVLAWVALWWRRRRRPGVRARRTDAAGQAYVDAGEDEQWSRAHGGPDTSVRLPSRYGEPPGGSPSGVDLLGRSGSGTDWAAGLSTDLATAVKESDDVDTAPTRIPSDEQFGTGRHAAVTHSDIGTDFAAGPGVPRSGAPAHPVMHLPLDDPYQAPSGYPVKANIGSGLYYTAENALYDDTLAEIWFASEEAAQQNGFIKAR